MSHHLLLKHPPTHFSITQILLILGCGVCWTLAYLIAILKGFQDKTYGIPYIALSANIAWEYVNSFITPAPLIQEIINVLWCALDVIITLQFFAYGRKTLWPKMSEGLFAIICVGIFGTSFALIYTAENPRNTAFGQNLTMSCLFIHMVTHRPGLLGQSIWIAIFKFFGTLFSSILFAVYFKQMFHPYKFWLLVMVLTSAADIIYICLVFMKMNNISVAQIPGVLDDDGDDSEDENDEKAKEVFSSSGGGGGDVLMSEELRGAVHDLKERVRYMDQRMSWILTAVVILVLVWNINTAVMVVMLLSAHVTALLNWLRDE